MFTDYYQMTDNPFTETPPSDWLQVDERFDQSLARLKFLQQQGNLGLITGQTGLGKSSLLELFKQALPRNRYNPVSFQLINVSPNAFLRMIVSQLGEAPRLGKDRLFDQIINKIRSNETETIFIIDEAHLLSSQALTDLRLLISIPGLPLKIILSGQESIGLLMKRSIHADFVNRISVQARLKPLTKTQTVDYNDHRLKCAGASTKLFDSEAKELIHDYSGGIPRMINNIAIACLINGVATNIEKIDATLVNQTMTEFRL